MALFLSTFVNKVDRKGRCSVPATFRAALATQSYEGIVCYRSLSTAALEGCGMDFMERLSAGSDQLAPFSSELDDLTSSIFADARQLPFDGEGRIVLPEDLCLHAGITEAAAFVGKGRSFQIWNPEAFKVAQDEARRRAAQARTTLPLRPLVGTPP